MSQQLEHGVGKLLSANVSNVAKIGQCARSWFVFNRPHYRPALYVALSTSTCQGAMGVFRFLFHHSNGELRCRGLEYLKFVALPTLPEHAQNVTYNPDTASSRFTRLLSHDPRAVAQVYYLLSRGDLLCLDTASIGVSRNISVSHKGEYR